MEGTEGSMLMLKSSCRDFFQRQTWYFTPDQHDFFLYNQEKSLKLVVFFAKFASTQSKVIQLDSLYSEL